MKISKLYGTASHPDLILYIIGTGPSLRLFPKEFLKNKLTLGLNYAYKYHDCDMNITVHPEVMPKDWNEKKQCWCVKHGKEPIPKPKSEIYWFDTNKMKKFNYTTLTSEDDRLYLGAGIQTTALCLAAKMGFKAAIMIGCDMCSLERDHHFEDEHTQFHGLSAREVYTEYYSNTAVVRYKLKEAYGMETLSMSPFLGLGHHERDYRRLCQEQDLPSIPSPVDISKYNRKSPDFI